VTTAAGDLSRHQVLTSVTVLPKGQLPINRRAFCKKGRVPNQIHKERGAYRAVVFEADELENTIRRNLGFLGGNEILTDLVVCMAGCMRT
jgi:hypothetical protein